jgi:predicted HicB family RNase H-like nuclease
MDTTKLTALETRIFEQAREMLDRGVDAPTFSAAFFGPSAELSQLCGSREERERLLKSELFRWLKSKWKELRLRDAVKFDQELKLASGRLTVAVPRSLHAALKSEAAAEGVSLSELIRLKLTIPYRQMTDLLIPPGRIRAPS